MGQYNKFYTAEKAKYGIFTGAVIPFARTLSGGSPGGGDYLQYAPAGYLKCNGAIYRSKDYPVLAELLGSGNNSRFKKFNVELQEANNDLSDGQFQVPDLGAKYINASSFPGGYNNLYTEDSFGNIVPVVGVAAELSLNQGTEVQVFYNGSFQVGRTEVPFSNAMNFASTLTPAVPTTTIQDIGYLGHAHFSNVVVKRSGPFTSNDTQSGNTSAITVSEELQISQSGGSEASTEHGHTIDVSSVSRSTSCFYDQFEVSGASLTTTVRMSQENTVKFDDIQHKFILVEYLIKF